MYQVRLDYTKKALLYSFYMHIVGRRDLNQKIKLIGPV